MWRLGTTHVSWPPLFTGLDTKAAPPRLGNMQLTRIPPGRKANSDGKVQHFEKDAL